MRNIESVKNELIKLLKANVSKSGGGQEERKAKGKAIQGNPREKG